MTPQQIVGMAVRLFAIWLVVIAFQLFAVATGFSNQLGVSAGRAIYFMPALPALLAVFLWFFPMTIAYKLVPLTRDENKLQMPAREATAAASAILGLWVLIGAIPQLLGRLGMAVASGASFSDGTSLVDAFFTPEHKVQLLALIFQCVFALVLVFKPWFIASKVFPPKVTTNANV